MLIKKMNASDLAAEFEARGRGDSFTIYGYQAIIEYFEEMGDTSELDVVALDCEFVESSEDDVLSDYSLESIAELNNETYCRLLPNGNIFYINF